MLDHYGVTEANWQEGAKKEPNFIASETPFYVGRAVAALAVGLAGVKEVGEGLQFLEPGLGVWLHGR